jgi:putative RecB family exonuclease
LPTSLVKASNDKLSKTVLSNRITGNRSWGRATAEEKIAFQSTGEEAQLLAKAGELVRAYLAKVRQETTPIRAVETAVNAALIDPRTGEDLGISLVGVIDLVLGEPDGSVIVDFKTAARADELSELVHEIQLGSYAYLFRKVTGTEESGLELRRLVKTKVPQVLFHRWPARSERHLGRLFTVIRAYLDDLNSARFVFRPGHACSYCDFRERHCQDWAG